MKKCRVYDKHLKIIRDVKFIDFANEEVMFYAYDYKEDGYYPNLDIVRSFDEVNIMRSTGIKDKNGVEIYEGDIVDYIYKGHTLRGKVVGNSGNPILMENIYDTSSFKSKPRESTKMAGECYVVGNIYQDQEWMN